MAFVKTAVSIERETFDAGEALAQELHISRSDLYTRALRTLLRQRKAQAMQRQIDVAAETLLQSGDNRSGIDEALHRAASASMHRAVERGESAW